MRAATEFAPGVWVTTSRRDTTTSTLVVGPSGRAVLVDPAWEADELDGLAAFTGERGIDVATGLATHAHHDHLLWHPAWGDVPRLASARTVALANEHRAELVADMGPDFPAGLGGLLGRLTPFAGDVLDLSGGPVEPVVHDGHAPGHTAYWWPDRRLLVTGDMLSDVELLARLSELHACRHDTAHPQPRCRRSNQRDSHEGRRQPPVSRRRPRRPSGRRSAARERRDGRDPRADRAARARPLTLL